jgi:vitamin B12 transporter
MPDKIKLAIGSLLAIVLGLPPVLWGQESNTLDTVVVTASRTEEKLREVSSSVTVISEETIRNSSATDMSELMRQQGFQVSGYNNGGKTITIRGMNQSQGGNDMNSAILVLLNGRRFGGPTLDYIGLTNVERIEVVRGPAAVQYGPAGMGAVINIITRRGSEKPTIYAEVGAGSFELEKVTLAASGQSKTGLIDFSVGFTQKNREDYKTGLGWTWKNTKTGNHIGFNTNVGLNFLNNHRLGLDFNAYRIRGMEGGATVGGMGGTSYYHPAPPILANANVTTADVDNYNLAFIYEGKTGNEKLNWMARYSFGKHKRESTGFGAATGLLGNTTTNWLDNKSMTATLGYEGDILSLSGGVDYIIYEIDSNRLPRTNGQITGPAVRTGQSEYSDLGMFLSGRLRFLEDSLIFSAGARYDRYEVKEMFSGNYDISDSNFSPSVGLAWLPLDWLKLRTNYSQGFRMPTVGEMWPSSPQIWFNPGLKPEQSKTWEIGADVSWEFVNASVTYFHSKWENKIFSTKQAETGCFSLAGVPSTCHQYINIKGATLAGWELAFNADIGQALNQDFELRPYVNLTWLTTRRNDDNSGADSTRSVQSLGFSTLTDVNEITVAYGVRFYEPNIDLTFNVNASYAGEKRTANWVDTRGAVWERHTPGTVVDLMIEKRLFEFQDKGKIKLKLEVNNIFDKYDEAYLHYPGPGRNYYLGLSYYLG